MPILPPYKQLAFKKAHKAASSVYDHPPKTVSYVSGCGAPKLSTYELKVDENGVPVYHEQGKVRGWRKGEEIFKSQFTPHTQGEGTLLAWCLVQAGSCFLAGLSCRTG